MSEEPRCDDIDPVQFGAKGDGISDDTEALQKALTICSRDGVKCRISRGRRFLAKAPLYIWGRAVLEGEGEDSCIDFDVSSAPYLLNVGISGPNRVQKAFSGTIRNVTFRMRGGMRGGQGGRIIFFWRTDGARIVDNMFTIGAYPYSATSSGNNQRWVANGFINCIRKNIIIKGNTIAAKAGGKGSEGIGLEHFDGALITDNVVDGVGDDPIGVHSCKNVKILNNGLKSVHGRLYVSNSKNVEIANNRVERVPSGQDGTFYQGISLLYIGFETALSNNMLAPTDICAHHNTLIFPEHAVDSGAAIYLYGPRNVSVKYNMVINNSTDARATGFHILPHPFLGLWDDPDKIDPAHIARVWGANIIGNVMGGRYPLPMIMTGFCKDYRGNVMVKDNSAAEFRFYCSNVFLSKNTNAKPVTWAESSAP